MAEQVQLPSVQLDLVREDLGDASRATILSGGAEAFALVDGQTLTVDVDNAGVQTVTFLAVDFDDIAEATAAEVAAVLNGATAGLTGATAAAESGQVRITSDSYGSTSEIDVTGGTANAELAFSTTPVTGADFTPVVELVNRIPEDGETEVPLDADVEIELHDGSGTAPALANVDVWIGGTQAVAAGVAQSGFSLSSSNPDAATLRLVVDPTADFDSDVDVDVRVTESGSSLDETYTFGTEDQTSPSVVSADARTQLIVRVTFSEPVLQSSASGATDALNPDNYAFSRNTTPAVDVVAESVAAVDASTVDVTVDEELSFGSAYLLTVTDVVDVYGNAIGPPTNAVEFESLAQPWPAGRRFLLWDFIPQLNKTEDHTGELALWIACLQDVTDLLLKLIDDWTTILDPDVAPERYLDAMLADLGNPFAFDLSEIDKRRLIRVLTDIYKEKGTAQGIIDVVRFFLGLDVTIETYNGLGWELAHSDSPTLDGQSPGSGPGDELSSAETEPADAAELGPGDRRLLYSFEIHSAVSLTDEQRARITQIAELMKPAHEHLVRIVEPTTPVEYDHLELGVSGLGKAGGPSGDWQLH